MRVQHMRMWAIGEVAPQLPPETPPPATPPETPPPAAPPGWVAQLPTDLRADESLTKFSTIGDLAKDYRETRGRLVELDGKVSKMIPRLPEKPTPDDLKAFRGAMGIPESPDKYQVKRPEWPATLGPYPEEMESKFKQFAHEQNMTPQQVQAAYDWYNQNILNAAQDMEKIAERRKSDAVKALQDKWGEAYKANAEIATRAFWFFADPQMLDWFETSGLGDNPGIIQMFHRIGLQLMDDRMVRDVKPPVAEKDKPKTDAFGRSRLSYPSMEQKK